jgi:hypothetical protein
MKGPLFIRLFIACTFLITSLNCFAQAYIEDIYFDLPETSSENEITNIDQYDLYIRLSDSLNVGSLSLKIGNTLHGNQVADCTYSLYGNNPTTCGGGFIRTGILIRLVLGSIHMPGVSFYEVELKDLQGNTISQLIKQI